MALTAVYMPPQVHYSCLLHALTVEKEEIMGMLIGKFDEGNNAYIVASIALQRSDKRKDRVEIPDDQSLVAMNRAAELSEQMNEPLNIIGWYHSHPHITVDPSVVDLRTQGNYQTMDPRFFGLIFSVFNEDKNFQNDMQVTCFQSIMGHHAPVRRPVPLIIRKERMVERPCIEEVCHIPSVIGEEQLISYNNALSMTKDVLTRLHNDAKLVSSVCHILQTTVQPLMLHLEHRTAVADNQQRLLLRERNSRMQEARERRFPSRLAVKFPDID